MAKKTNKVMEERLEDILWSCRNHLHGELAANNYSLVPSRYIEFVDRDTEIDYKTARKDAGAKTKELLERQAENARRLTEAFKALGVRL